MTVSRISIGRSIARFLVPALLVIGCSSSNDDDQASAPGAATGDDTSAKFQCSSDPRVQTYVANIETPGMLGRARFVLTSADPAPPRRGLNAWTLHVVDTNGAAIPEAEITVSGVMPDHQHGWSTVPTITKSDDGMTFTVEKMNLSMGGVWSVTFELQTKNADGSANPVDRATFTFCIG